MHRGAWRPGGRLESALGSTLARTLPWPRKRGRASRRKGGCFDGLTQDHPIGFQLTPYGVKRSHGRAPETSRFRGLRMDRAGRIRTCDLRVMRALPGASRCSSGRSVTERVSETEPIPRKRSSLTGLLTGAEHACRFSRARPRGMSWEHSPLSGRATLSTGQGQGARQDKAGEMGWGRRSVGRLSQEGLRNRQPALLRSQSTAGRSNASSKSVPHGVTVWI